LKPAEGDIGIVRATLKEKHPLKQGLKHPDPWQADVMTSSKREASIKTRIETLVFVFPYSPPVH